MNTGIRDKTEFETGLNCFPACDFGQLYQKMKTVTTLELGFQHEMINAHNDLGKTLSFNKYRVNGHYVTNLF